MSEFSEKLKAERKRLHISQMGFNKVFGIPATTVWSWENEKRVPPEWAARLLIEKLESMEPLKKQRKKED